MTVSWQEYVDQRFADFDRRIVERFTLSDAAVDKAEQKMNERLNAMNEFRDALKDQANRMATRVELETVSDQVDEMRRGKANFDGRLAVVSAGISLIMSIIVGLIVARFR